MNGFNTNLKSRSEFVWKFLDESYDPFADDYRHHLAELNKVIDAIGEPLEGNLFYDHHQLDRSIISAQYLPKRRMLALMGLMFEDVVEIGFNGGHSALLMLTANPRLKLTCIDICHHKYTVPCFEYLKSVFGDRIDLINANSLMAFPLLARRGQDFGLYIIDGGHGVDVAEADLFNVIQYGRKGSVILFDDSDYPPIRLVIDMHLLTGNLIPIADQIGFIKNFQQMIFLNNRQ